MSTNYTFPHTEFNVHDKSVTNTPTVVNSSLHLPLFFITASKGDYGKIVYGSATDLQTAFGKDVFDEDGKYYSHANMFAHKATTKQNICCIRVNGNTPKAYNTIVAKLSVDKSTGKITTNYVFNDSKTNDLTRVNETSTDNSYSISFPMISIEATGAGSVYNNYGIIFDLSGDTTVPTKESPSTVVHKLQIVKQTDIGLTPITDIYTSTSSSIALSTTSTVDSNTKQELSLQSVVESNYTNLPFKLRFNDICIKKFLQKAFELLGISDQYTNSTYLEINLFGNDTYPEYANMSVSSSWNDGDINNATYTPCILKNGVDRSDQDKDLTTDEYLDKCTKEYMNDALTSEYTLDLFDTFRFPITHVYDSGFTNDTKVAISNLYQISPLIIIDWATYTNSASTYTGYIDPVLNQLNSLTGNDLSSTYRDDMSQASWISAMLGNTLESELFKTGFMRGNIFGQTGHLVGISQTKNVAFTLNNMMTRCTYHAGDSITGDLTPRPNNTVTLFKDVSYTVVRPDDKQQAWDTYMNVAQYADNEVLFYPTYVTMHKTSNSLLSTTLIVDYLVYIKKIIMNRWTYFTGSRIPNDLTFSDVSKAIQTDIYYAFNDKIECNVKTYQSVSNRVNGKSISIAVTLISGFPISTWDNELIVEVAAPQEAA